MGDSYQNFRLEDFVADDYFQRWVQHPEPAAETFWQQWLAENPDKAPIVEEARQLILQLRTQTYTISADKLDQQMHRLNQRLDRWDTRQITFAPIAQPKSQMRWWIAAAVIVMAVASAVLWLSWRPDTMMVATGYGETRSVWLPDSSKVELNSNSSIRYASNWRTGQTREVWLEGEAFFSVRHQTLPGGKVKFTVHTHDLDVNVLGTRFNVYNRGEQTRIVLNSGKIALLLAESNPSLHQTSTGKEIAMLPGDYVVYSSKHHELVRKTVNPEEHSAWRDGQLKFNFTSLREIAQVIEETYGYQVVINDSLVASKKISGTLPANNIDILLKALQEGFELKSQKQGNTIILE